MSQNPAADGLLRFIESSPSPYHAVDYLQNRIQKEKGEVLEESKGWKLQPRKLHSVVRHGGTLAVFRVPESSKDLRFHVVCAHTDSPCLKLKPRPKNNFKNYQQWGTEPYGGTLYNSWLDRDLQIAGRVSHATKGKTLTKNILLNDIACRVPQLAIHLDREVNTRGLVLNAATHLVPVLGLSGERDSKDLMLLIREAARIPKTLKNEDLALDLVFSDKMPPAYGGLNREFIFAPRLDNLAMCHAAVEALLAAPPPKNAVQVAILFDHEEIGSQSAQGANSNFIGTLLERICLSFELNKEAYLQALAGSFLISADMAHGIHPNYPERHDGEHFPLLGKGPVIKINANQRYATSAPSAAFAKNLCRSAGVPYQEFVNRPDLACGTTVGPIVSSLTGVSTVDMGNAMLSMHSAREMAAGDDHPLMIRVFREFFSRC